MDYLSKSPDMIIHHIISFLATTDIARLYSVSQLFRSITYEYFLSLCHSHYIQSDSPVLEYGKIHSRKLLVLENWSSETPTKQYFPYNLVKSVKFGKDFISILRYDGSLYSTIETTEPTIIETNVQNIDCCEFGMIIKKHNNQVIWFKQNSGNVIKTL